MKKLYVLILVFVLCLSGCGADEKPEGVASSPPGVSSEEAEPTIQEVIASAWPDAEARGSYQVFMQASSEEAPAELSERYIAAAADMSAAILKAGGADMSCSFFLAVDGELVATLMISQKDGEARSGPPMVEKERGSSYEDFISFAYAGNEYFAQMSEPE